MSSIRILMATDVPFWRSRTGAQQRIDHLIAGLATSGIAVKTFYVGPADESDRKLVADRQFDVDFRSSDQRPTGLARTLKWRFDGTINLARQTLARQTPGRRTEPKAEQGTDANRSTSVRLADFRWPWAIDAFRETVNEFQPDVFLSQYITMAYLMEGLSASQRDSTHCIVDTHDVLSHRAEQFAQFGYPHWIAIDRDEESKTLKKFDSVLVIHPAEETVFQELAPDAKTIIVGHSVEKLLQSAGEIVNRNLDSNVLRIGYFASANHSNEHAIGEFLKDAWPQLSSAELVIAGGICESLNSLDHVSQDESIQLIGPVGQASDFYSCVDLVINPVAFGAGLKIKNCEAFAFGKPAVVTQHGFDALPRGCDSAVVIADSVTSMADKLRQIAEDPSRLAILQSEAIRFAEDHLSDSACYAALAELLASKS